MGDADIHILRGEENDNLFVSTTHPSSSFFFLPFFSSLSL